MTVIPYVLEGRSIEQREATELLQRGQVGPLEGFQNAQGASYMGILRMHCGPHKNIVVVDAT